MDVILSADPRPETGSAPARRLRARGQIPAVVYGVGVDSPLSVAVNRRQLIAALSTEAGLNALITVEVGDEQILTLAREIQRDPVRNELIHLDFLAIRRDQEVTADIPVSMVGEAPALREGLQVSQVAPTISISALPGNLPTVIEADVSGLATDDDGVRAGDLTLPDGVTLVTPADDPIVVVTVPAAEEPTVAVVAEADEPEAAPGAEAKPGGDADAG